MGPGRAGGCKPGPDGLYPPPIPAGGSSNGRTPDSDSGCLGSNPSPPAKIP